MIIFTRAYTNMVNVSDIRTRVYWKIVYVYDGYHIILLGSRSVCYHSYLINYTCWDLFPGD